MTEYLRRRRRFGRGTMAAALVVAGGVAIATLTTAQPAAPGSWLEFELAPEEAPRLTSVLVGYFNPGDPLPAFVFEVPRPRIEMPRAGVMRVPLIVGKLPAGRTYEVRLRTVIRKQRSDWSQPSGKFTVPADGGAPGSPAPKEAAKRAPEPGGKQGGRSASTELKNNPELAARMSKAFPGLDLAEAAAGFRTVRDLGTALFLSSNLKVSFQDIKRLTADKGNRDFLQAIAALKPGADARAEEQRALRQSRQAIRAPPNKRG